MRETKMPLSTISYKTWLNDISRVRNTNQADALLNTFVDVHVLCFFFFLTLLTKRETEQQNFDQDKEPDEVCQSCECLF